MTQASILPGGDHKVCGGWVVVCKPILVFSFDFSQAEQLDSTCHHEINGVTYVSAIDHFFWNEAMDDCVDQAGVLHMIDNSSNHSVIYCVADIGDILLENQEHVYIPPKPNLKRASKDQKDTFKNTVENKLANVHFPCRIKSM